MLTINELNVTYGVKSIIKNLNLPAINAGMLTVIVGPNGAGKSTLLKAIAGIQPYSGSIGLCGEEVASMPARLRASRIGFMPQVIPQRHGLTVLEATMNVLFLTGQGSAFSNRDGVATTALKCLERMGLDSLSLMPLHSLSGGQRQMASLAQALVFEPQVILLDEPTSALDLAHQIRVMSTAKRLADEGRVVVATLHDLSVASRYADNIVVLHNGNLMAWGAPNDVLTADLLKKVYGVEANICRMLDGGIHINVQRELL